jgi:hypothetical protein
MVKFYYGVNMNFNRRNFLLKIGLFSVVTGTFKRFGIANASTFKKTSSNPFPYVSSVKFYYPSGKTHDEIIADIHSWNNKSKFNNVTENMIKNSQMSPKKDKIISNDHVEYRLYFSSKEACDNYKNKMSEQKVVQTERQNHLGYKVICNYFYS